jgi:hypothetical protein
MIGPRREGADSHQRRFLFGQGLVTQNHFSQVLGLPGVDPAVRAETELPDHRAVDALDRHLEAIGNLLSRKARALPLCLSSRRVLARSNEPGVNSAVVHTFYLPVLIVSILPN